MEKISFKISDYSKPQKYFRSGVRKGIIMNIPLQRIVKADKENRDFNKNHSKNLGEKIENSGWMDAIKVAPFIDENGIQLFKIAESNHRGEWLNSSNGPDETVPCVVLWWIDGNDEEAMYNAITELNTGGKNHTLYDTIVRAARVMKSPIYVEMANNIHQYTSRTSSKTSLSVGNLVGIYDGYGQPSNPKNRTKKDRTPTKTGKFKLPPSDRPYVDHMLKELVKLKSVLGSELQNDWLENFIFEMHTQKNKLQNFDKWKAMFDYLCDSIKTTPQQTGKSRALFNKWFTGQISRMHKFATL